MSDDKQVGVGTLLSATVLAMLLVATGMKLSGAGGGESLVVHGDSTAIASRIPWSEKLWNAYPAVDNERWWNQLNRRVYNDGVKGQSIVEMRDNMLRDKDHRTSTTIIYDLVNDRADARNYVHNLAAAIATLKTTHFLIIPQVPPTDGTPNGERADIAALNRVIPARWPNNTFSEAERRAFLGALSSPDTRADGLHRNAKGERIEARFILAFLARHGW